MKEWMWSINPCFHRSFSFERDLVKRIGRERHIWTYVYVRLQIYVRIISPIRTFKILIAKSQVAIRVSLRLERRQTRKCTIVKSRRKRQQSRQLKPLLRICEIQTSMTDNTSDQGPMGQLAALRAEHDELKRKSAEERNALAAERDLLNMRTGETPAVDIPVFFC